MADKALENQRLEYRKELKVVMEDQSNPTKLDGMVILARELEIISDSEVITLNDWISNPAFSLSGILG